MSLRDEVAKAAHERACGCTDSQIEGNTYWGGLADAAMAVVCSHVNRLADELKAEARQRDKEAAILNDTWTTLRATKRGIAAASRNAARRVQSLCEEQTENEK